MIPLKMIGIWWLMTIAAELERSSLNSFAALMYDKMETVCSEKYSGYTVHLLDRWPPLSSIDCECYIGSMVMTSQVSKQRWMLKKHAVPFAGTWVTAADLARAYLNIKYKGVKRRITTIQWKEFYEHRRQMPLSAFPCEIPNAYYIDIRSAYWTILRAVGWEVDYMPLKWLSVKNDLTVNDFPFQENKMARNCLVSLAADGSRMMQVWTGKEIQYRKGGNGLVNKMLYSLVADVLNAVACECLAAGAVYSFTDGFIVPDYAVGAVEDTIAAWGLSTSVKHAGPSTVKSVGAYRIGGFRTKKFDRQGGHSFSKIAAHRTEWLRKRFKHFSDKYGATVPFDEPNYIRRLNRKLR